MKTVDCLLCGSSDMRPFLDLPDLMLGLPDVFHLVRCTRCGLVYQNPCLDEQEMARHYPPDYAPFVHPPWSEPRLLNRIVRLYGYRKRWKLVERWASARPSPWRLLDVGCATGTFLAAGSSQWQTVGIEPVATAAEFARHKLGLTVFQGTLDTVDLPAASFDAITMWDVLEHLHSPVETLIRVHRLLRPGGIFVCRIPNLRAWDARVFGRYWAGLDQPRHLFVPDEQTIGHMLDAAGFVELDRRCLSGTYSMLAISWGFWIHERIQNPGWQRRLQGIMSNMVSRIMLTPVLWGIDHVARKGSLLTIVARAEPV